MNKKQFAVLIILLFVIPFSYALQVPIGWQSWEMPTGKYAVVSQTGDERVFDVSINKNTICLNVDAMSKQLVNEETGKLETINVPMKLPLEVNGIPLKTELSLTAKAGGAKVCYTANPLVDYTLKFGTQSA